MLLTVYKSEFLIVINALGGLTCIHVTVDVHPRFNVQNKLTDQYRLQLNVNYYYHRQRFRFNKIRKHKIYIRKVQTCVNYKVFPFSIEQVGFGLFKIKICAILLFSVPLICYDQLCLADPPNFQLKRRQTAGYRGQEPCLYLLHMNVNNTFTATVEIIFYQT